ncbi:MAG: tetratricopeptide repeat protein [Planctomycetota bacterium]
MDKGIRRLAAFLLGLFFFFAGPGLSLLQAAEVVAAEAPDPFTPVPVHTETMMGKWRHAFHHVRTTWEESFRVVPDEMAGYEPTTLEKVKTDLLYNLERKIQVDIVYGKAGSFFRPFSTPFHKDTYVNFTGWSYGAAIWEKAVRGDVLPSFYIDRQKSDGSPLTTRNDLVDKVQALPMFTPLHLWAIVRATGDNLPYIEVIKAEVIPETALTTETLRHIELGYIELNKRRYDMAALAFEGALKLQLPVNAEEKVYGMLGKAYFEQRLFSGARNALVNAILRDEHDVNNLVLLARADLRLDKAGEAREAAERAVGIEPANGAAHAELGLALALLGDPRAGCKELDAAQKLTPNLADANRNRAVVFAHEGKLELARDELKQAIIARPTEVDYKIELGDIYITLGNLDLAKTEFTQGRELAPQRPEPYYKVAVVAKKLGDAAKKDGKEDAAKKAYEEALENVKGAISKDDQFTPAYGLEAEILRALGRSEEAKKVLDSGSQKAPILDEPEVTEPTPALAPGTR